MGSHKKVYDGCTLLSRVSDCSDISSTTPKTISVLKTGINESILLGRNSLNLQKLSNTPIVRISQHLKSRSIIESNIVTTCACVNYYDKIICCMKALLIEIRHADEGETKT